MQFRMALVVALISVCVLGCSQSPKPRLIVSGGEGLAGATVYLDGTDIGTMERLEEPPWLVLKLLSLVHGDRGPYESKREVWAFIFDLAGLEEGMHNVAIQTARNQVVELSFVYPEDAVATDGAETGTVFLPVTLDLLGAE
jgi:hypothetical protein